MIPVGHRPIARVLVKRSELSVDQSYEKMVSPPLLPAPKLSRHLRDRILGFLPFQPRPTALRHIGTETLAKSKFRNNLANVAFILFSSFSLLSLVPAPYYFRFDSLSGKLFACWRTTLCCYHFASVYLQWDSFEERERNRNEAILGEKQFFNRMNFLLEG